MSVHIGITYRDHSINTTDDYLLRYSYFYVNIFVYIIYIDIDNVIESILPKVRL